MVLRNARLHTMVDGRDYSDQCPGSVQRPVPIPALLLYPRGLQQRPGKLLHLAVMLTQQRSNLCFSTGALRPRSSISVR